MSEEIKIGDRCGELTIPAVVRSLEEIIDKANYSGYGNAVTREIERLQTKLSAAEQEADKEHAKAVELSDKLIEARNLLLAGSTRVAELEADKARLDWLIRFSVVKAGTERLCLVIPNKRISSATLQTEARSAIDSSTLANHPSMKELK